MGYSLPDCLSWFRSSNSIFLPSFICHSFLFGPSAQLLLPENPFASAFGSGRPTSLCSCPKVLTAPAEVRNGEDCLRRHQTVRPHKTDAATRGLKPGSHATRR